MMIDDKSLEFGLLIEPRHFTTLDAIRSVTDKFYITGSIALSMMGIIRRPINDVDVVVWDKLEMQKIYEAFGGEFYENYDQDKKSDFTGNAPTHLRFDLGGIGVCVFFIQCESTRQITVNSRTYTVSDPQHIFRAKCNYIHEIANRTTTPESLKRLLKNMGDVDDYIFYLNNKLNQRHNNTFPQ